MYKKKLTGANWVGMALVLSMFASCNDELIKVPSVTEDRVIVKEGIINPADKVLMVHIDRGSTESVQTMADETGAIYARPVFDMSTGDVQLKKSLGLDNGTSSVSVKNVNLTTRLLYWPQWLPYQGSNTML